MSFLKKERTEEEDLKYFQDIFQLITVNANHKEMFLGLLEQFDPLLEFDLVKLLFPALKTCTSCMMYL